MTLIISNQKWPLLSSFFFKFHFSTQKYNKNTWLDKSKKKKKKKKYQ